MPVDDEEDCDGLGSDSQSGTMSDRSRPGSLNNMGRHSLFR